MAAGGPVRRLGQLSQKRWVPELGQEERMETRASVEVKSHGVVLSEDNGRGESRMCLAGRVLT